MALKNLNDVHVSFLKTFTNPKYNQWQRDNLKKQPAAVKVFLPPVESVSAKKKEDEKHSQSKPKDNLSGKKSASASHSKKIHFRKGKTAQQTAFEYENRVAKGMKNIKILEHLCKAEKDTLEEVKHHSHFLLEKNQQLLEDIQEKDSDTAQHARHLLQQYEMFGMIITTLQDSSQNQVGVAKAELKATEKMMKKNVGKLEQELSRMNSKVQTLQEELNFLRTYMDKEYPVQSVQIASLLRSIRQLSEEQQDELEDAKDMSKQFLNTLAERTLEETECIFQAVVAILWQHLSITAANCCSVDNFSVTYDKAHCLPEMEEKVSEYYGGLQQMSTNNREMRRQIQKQKKIIDDLKKEIETLQKNLILLHQYTRHPREVIFEDVLLQRPKCTPDMEIVLNIPTEEDLRL